MALPQDFLVGLAKEKYLSQKEAEVLLAVFGSNKSRVEIVQSLNISDSALGTRLSGIYKKFSIVGSGPVKLGRLQDHLTDRYLQQQPIDPNQKNNTSQTEQIINLVQEVRQKTHADIQERCSTMRVLDMEQPITLNDIYNRVDVLEKVMGRRRMGLTELLEKCDLDDFARPNLNGVQEQKLPGLEAVKRYQKLMILGKPGAGKTTFR